MVFLDFSGGPILIMTDAEKLTKKLRGKFNPLSSVELIDETFHGIKTVYTTPNYNTIPRGGSDAIKDINYYEHGYWHSQSSN